MMNRLLEDSIMPAESSMRRGRVCSSVMVIFIIFVQWKQLYIVSCAVYCIYCVVIILALYNVASSLLQNAVTLVQVLNVSPVARISKRTMNVLRYGQIFTRSNKKIKNAKARKQGEIWFYIRFLVEKPAPGQTLGGSH